MVNKEELLEELGLFGKLDIKFVLDSLSIKNNDNSSLEYIELNDELFNLILDSLSLLIKFDDNFVEVFNNILNNIDENQVANINIDKTINRIAIKGLLSLVQLLNKNIVNSEEIRIKRDNLGNIINGNYNTILVNNSKENLLNINDFEDANIVFNSPTKIYLNQSKKVILRISKNIIPTNDLNENYQIEKSIKTTKYLSAKLSSIDFEIISLNTEKQYLNDFDFTEWQWIITPKVKKIEGTIYLLISSIVFLSESKELKKDFPVFKKYINIMIK